VHHSVQPLSAVAEARRLANAGLLTEALESIDRAIKGNKLDAELYYLRAVILQEIGSMDESALASLKKALYIDPAFALAHFAAAQISRRLGKSDEAGKHFRAAIGVLSNCASGAPVPYSDGLPPAKLREMIEAAISGGAS
jgi:chemotaxis protein methyltransferase CheR